MLWVSPCMQDYSDTGPWIRVVAFISSIHGCRCHSQGSAVWAAVRARSFLTSRCDQRFLLLLSHRNRLWGAMQAPTTAAKPLTVREMDFIDKTAQKDGPPFLYPRAARECLFARVVMFGRSVVSESTMHECFGASSYLVSRSIGFANASEFAWPRSIALTEGMKHTCMQLVLLSQCLTRLSRRLKRVRH